MKQAKQHKGAHGHVACGNCGRAVRLRAHADRLACTTHLEVVAIDRAVGCEDYSPTSASGAPPVAMPETKTDNP